MKNESSEKKLGTFLGVYTPTILTILGVIMYLRFGWIIGHLGLGQALLAVILANSITLITTISFSSVATNSRIGVGGAYFIISRSLGLEVGVAIGLPLFFSQVFSVTLYAFGLAESLRIVWPEAPIMTATFVIILAVAALTLVGARVALKVQVPLMAFIGISIVALCVGALSKFSGGSLPIPSPSGEVPFWSGFAIFFPAVTGVMAGLGLSGDLRDPERSIPFGAFGAVLTGFAVYLLVPVILALGASPEELRAEPMIWSRIAPLGPWLILPGLWGAIFSSAVASMLGAPRTLQALAMDRIAPRLFGRPTGDWKALLPGFILSLLLALAAVFLGDLNAVATVVSMFFLTVYGTLNIVAALESLSGDPSWRPRLLVPWPVNLIGGMGCMAVMFLINPIVGIIAFTAEIGLWFLLSRKERTARWGDARRGIYESMIRWALIRLAHRPVSARNWRPHVLVFVPDPLHRLDLIRFGNWFSQGRGVVTACELVVGDLLAQDLNLMDKRREMQEVLDKERLVVFADVNAVQNVVDGITNVSQANGLASLESNTVLLGWPNERSLLVEFLRTMHRLERLNTSMVIGRIQPRYLFPREGIERTIHVWWGGLERNGDLMLLLAYLLTQNAAWRRAHVKVMSVASSELAKVQTESYLEKLIPEIRIDADVHVILKDKEMSVREQIHMESKDAEVVFFGLAVPEVGNEEAYAERLEELAGELPTVFFVKNSSLFMGEFVRSEENQQPSPEKGM